MGAGAARIALAAMLTAGANRASGYEVAAVTDPGGVHGRVVLEGAPPTAVKTAIERDTKVCGTHIEEAAVQVGKDGGLANVAVWLADIESGAAPDFAATPKLDNVQCRFVPHVQTLAVGETLLVRNSDPILHNTHAYVLEGDGNLFNLALPTQGKEIRKPIKKTGIQQVKCDAGHTWMNAYFLVFDHPYHTVSDAAGSFSLKGIPPGTYTLRAWHETLGKRDVQVKVTAGGTAEIAAITFAAPASPGR
jgi:hypothetical protein